MIKLLSILFEVTPHPMYVKDAKGRFVIVNRAFAHLFGLTPEAIIEKGVLEEDYSQERDLGLLNAHEVASLEEYYKTATGAGAWFQTTKKVFIGPEGGKYLLSISGEITACKTALQKSQEHTQLQQEQLDQIRQHFLNYIKATQELLPLLLSVPLTPAQEKSLRALNSLSGKMEAELAALASPPAAEDMSPTQELQPSSPEPILYDFSGLGNIAEDAVFIQKMQRLFIDIVPEQLTSLTTSVAKRDWKETATIAHKLKSTYANIKIIEATTAMKKIEENATTRKDLEQIPTLLQHARDITDRVVAIFTRELG
ncbi:PAS domain S-box protein [Rufibacter immobilis]|uniref:PAS domain S-box protein n=1 Tax=Rufibacter immobilis TaxID=1348778 RepID=UPI0035E84017